jgi:hypothetical protein
MRISEYFLRSIEGSEDLKLRLYLIRSKVWPDSDENERTGSLDFNRLVVPSLIATTNFGNPSPAYSGGFGMNGRRQSCCVVPRRGCYGR